MKALDKVTLVLAKILEVGHWIGAVGMLVGLGLSLFPGMVQDLGTGMAGESVATYGFELAFVDNAGQMSMAALRFYLVGAALILALMAMVFRNINLILKKSVDATPFQEDNVRMVREIGIFLIAVPVVSLIMSTLARLVVGPEMIEASGVGLSSFMVGLVMLCLSRIFAHGVELEDQTDGLL